MSGSHSTRGIAAAFGMSALASIGLAVVYVQGGQTQLEGLLLATALGGIAVGLVMWAKHLMSQGHVIEAREVVPPQTDEREEVEETYQHGAEEIGRRTFLSRWLIGALGALGLAALFPVRSLGVAPGDSLFRTAWRPGARLVRADGTQVRPQDLAPNGVLTVFPENHTHEADSQVVVIRLPSDVELPGPEEFSTEGLVAFSKICTHAGCPVGLYQTQTRQLFCPCHQSAFDVLQRARPVSGPATRPLPQLPLGIDEEGFVVAAGDFPEPVGPGFWNRRRG